MYLLVHVRLLCAQYRYCFALHLHQRFAYIAAATACRAFKRALFGAEPFAIFVDASYLAALGLLCPRAPPAIAMAMMLSFGVAMGTATAANAADAQLLCTAQGLGRVHATCCPESQCANGLPAACPGECSAILLDFDSRCQQFLRRQNPQVQKEFSQFARLCGSGSNVTFATLEAAAAKLSYKMPTTANQLTTVAGGNATRQVAIARMASETTPFLHARSLQLANGFLELKRREGSAIEQTVYKGVDGRQLITRLLSHRPLVFMGAEDVYMLRTGQTGIGKDLFPRIGTSPCRAFLEESFRLQAIACAENSHIEECV
eukprot:COSAG05_NODE_3443_length_2060_cov_2.943906_1_plen_317_part_00